MTGRWPRIDGPDPRNQGGAGPPAGRRLNPPTQWGCLRIVAGVGEQPSVNAAPARALDLRNEPVRTMTIRRAILLGPISPRTWRAVASLLVSLVTGAFFFVFLICALLISGALSWIVGLGMLVLSFTLRLAARMARLDRRRVRRFAGARVEPAPLPEAGPDLSFRERQKAWAQSPAVRRLVVYQIVRLPVTGASLTALGFTVTGMVAGFSGPEHSALRTLLGVACLFGWPLVARLGAAIDVSLVRWLLGPSRSGQLSAEVQRLGEARTLAVESAETERRRIERDLHDGLQPKLVSLALELGLAKARFERDPGSAISLIDRAHNEAKTAIEDLRSLVRGIHPSVLDERGLDAALSALIASCPVPVHVEVTLSRRPDQTREAVAYFVVAESITNVTKHSGATRASVIINEGAGLLRVLVEDDGPGGARVEPGGGLAGLAARVTAIDGTFTVISPPGGPTHIEAVIPCAP
jgi:signal transduction histidine kinase